MCNTFGEQKKVSYLLNEYRRKKKRKGSDNKSKRNEKE